MKKITLVFTGHRVSDALLAFGKKIGGKFRNYHYVVDREPCDYVAGDVIPEIYDDVPRHPDWPQEGEAGLTGSTLPPQGVNDPQRASEDASGGSTGSTGEEIEPEEVELTPEYLESLSKEELLELAKNEGVSLTKAQKKTAESLVRALSEYFGFLG